MLTVFTNYQICQRLNKSGVHASSTDDTLLDFLMSCLCFILIAFCAFILFFMGVALYNSF